MIGLLSFTPKRAASFTSTNNPVYHSTVGQTRERHRQQMRRIPLISCGRLIFFVGAAPNDL
jgi:hypothetical protein